MQYKRLCCAFAFYLLPTIALRAEGLLQTLPDDGAAVVYDLKQEGEIAGEGGTSKVLVTGTARVSIVGTQTVAGLKCRWVELELDHELSLGEEKSSQLVYSKVLLLEQDLIESGDPLGRAIKIFSMKSPGDEEPRLIVGKEERRLALWSIGNYFPKSPTKENRLNRMMSSQRIQTPAGQFDCVVHAFDSFVDHYLLGPSRTQECRIHRIWKNSTSPFGVVAMNVHSEAQQVSIPDAPFAGESDLMSRGSVTMTTELRLHKVETNAVSRFPKHK